MIFDIAIISLVVCAYAGAGQPALALLPTKLVLGSYKDLVNTLPIGFVCYNSIAGVYHKQPEPQVSGTCMARLCLVNLAIGSAFVKWYCSRVTDNHPNNMGLVDYVN